MSFQALDSEFESRVRASFSRQKAMDLIGASLGSVAPGRVEVARAEVYSEDGRHVASMQQTLMMLADTPDKPE